MKFIDWYRWIKIIFNVGLVIITCRFHVVMEELGDVFVGLMKRNDLFDPQYQQCHDNDTDDIHDRQQETEGSEDCCFNSRITGVQRTVIIINVRGTGLNGDGLLCGSVQ